MVNNNSNINLIVKENYKQVEEVREIENQIPTYEEFLKNYEKGDVNYDDLNGGEVGESKGYGPCYRSDCNCSVDITFYLNTTSTHNWLGMELAEAKSYFYTSSRKILTNEGDWTSGGEFFAAPDMVPDYEWRTFQLRLRSIGKLEDLLYNLGDAIVIYSSNRGITTGIFSTSHSRRTSVESEIRGEIRGLINKYERGESVVKSYEF